MEFVIAALLIIGFVLCCFGEVHTSLIEAVKSLIAARAAAKTALYAEAALASKARFDQDRAALARQSAARAASAKEEANRLLCALHKMEYPQAWDNSLRGSLVNLNTKRGMYSLHWEEYRREVFDMLNEAMQK